MERNAIRTPVGEKQVPMGRLGEPEDISKAVTFLASNAASHINGIGLFADGGMVQV
jgi:NAD(P)-dependent dehydrogenase (short-subunit alcohol dehydrogenase family)